MIKVKALEWAILSSETVTAPVGMREFYEIRIDRVTNMWYWEYSGVRLDDRRYTLLDAKSACQAHHEQHVLSMIEVEG